MNLIRKTLDKIAAYRPNAKMVLIVRTDLNMGRGKIASQCAHAATTLYNSALKSASPCVDVWFHAGQPKVVLRVDQNCEKTLREVYNLAVEGDLNACLIRDAGRTQIKSGTITVVGLGPNQVDQIDKLTKHFKLL